MPKSLINKNQMVCLITVFLLGNNIIFGINTTAGRDAWLALLIAAACSVPVVWVYSRILALYPQQDFFDAVKTMLGNTAGAVAIVLFIAYALHQAALLLRTMTEFVDTNSLPNPPHMFFPIAFLLAALFLIKKGLPVLGKWAVIMLMFALFTLVSTGVFSLKDMHLEWLLPVMRKPPEVLVKSAFQLLAFPFLECLMFLPLLAQTPKDAKPFGLFVRAIAISAAFLLLILFRNITLLGEPMLQRQFFPSFAATKIVSVGTFLTRLEESIAVYLIFTSLTHFAVCLYSASLGLKKLFGISDIKGLYAPVALVVLTLSCFVANSMMDLTKFVGTYPYYACMFQIIIPVIVLVIGTIRKKRHAVKGTQ